MGEKSPRYGGGDFDVEARIRDMDEEGADVHMMVPGGIPHTDDPDLEMAFIRAQHRYLNDFAGKYPPLRLSLEGCIKDQHSEPAAINKYGKMIFIVAARRFVSDKVLSTS